MDHKNVDSYTNKLFFIITMNSIIGLENTFIIIYDTT